MSADLLLETLPVHPGPEPLESLSGYVIRLATSNGIFVVDAIATSLFPQESVRIIRRMNDMPGIELDTLHRRTGCSIERLLETTFYYLVRKFERTPDILASAKFLAGAVSDTLRYCPQCLAENMYYRLPWRMLMLSGCPQHGRRLLDRCGHCGAQIPLLASNLKIGVCPSCRGELSLCISEPLPQSEQELAAKRWDDLEYLLTPQPWEQRVEHPAQMLGQVYARVRRHRREKGAEVAAALGTTVNRVYQLELGTAPNRAGPFTRYVAYADYLELTMREMFEQ
jgi:hypothetical protein